MSKRDRFDHSNWKYVWGIGWFDPDGTSIIPFGSPTGCGCVIFTVLLVMLAIGVVEWVFPWLPWL